MGIKIQFFIKRQFWFEAKPAIVKPYRPGVKKSSRKGARAQSQLNDEAGKRLNSCIPGKKTQKPDHYLPLIQF
jgi:hypothetical protein